jgi:Tol biopolymer transport system component
MRRRIALLTITALIALGPTLGGGSATAGTPVVSGKIAFYRDGAPGVFTIDPDGTNEIPLGEDLVLGSNEAWSPDGSKLLVFEFLQGEGARPATINADGSDLTLLDAYPDLVQHLQCGFWSPDGTRFLCQTLEDVRPVNGLYTLRSSDGGDLTRITTSPRASSCASREGACYEDIPRGYSPDGSLILFNRQKRSTHLGRLFLVHPDGTGLSHLSPPGLRIRDEDPGSIPADWSPDGSQISFVAFRKTDEHQRTALYVVNTDGTGLHRITPFSLGARHGARWSPDGERIAFSTAFGRTRFGEGPQIWVVNPAGADLLELTYPVHGQFSLIPVWSPDSTQLVFQGQGNLRIVNADGSGFFQLTNLAAGDNTPAWGTAPASQGGT